MLQLVWFFHYQEQNKLEPIRNEVYAYHRLVYVSIQRNSIVISYVFRKKASMGWRKLESTIYTMEISEEQFDDKVSGLV